MAGAELCEAQGPAPDYPVGLVFGDHRVTNPQAYWRDCTFAVAISFAVGHTNWPSCWVAGPADDPRVDRFKASLTLPLKPWPGNLGPDDGHLDPAHPSFERMVAKLDELGAAFWVWDGTAAIPGRQWLRRF